MYAATLLVWTSVRGLALIWAARYISIALAIISMGCMIVKERRPRPFSPAVVAEDWDVAAIQAGGCGSWYGLGVTIRRGNEKLSLSYSKYSSRHMPQMISMASRHSSRLFSRSTPNAVCSMGVDRPVPHWTRPLDSTSTVATFSATRAGWMKPKGVRVTPNPIPICSVRWESAPSTTSDEGQCDRPSRKWCSTTQQVLNPSVSARVIWSMAS